MRSSFSHGLFSIFWLVTAWLLGTHFAVAEDGKEPLKADEAFQPKLEAVTAERASISWDIAEGYFLYRHRFQFSTATPGTTLGEPKIPPGKPKHDEYFGDVETYRHKVTVEVPYTTTAAGAIEVKAGYQGCADLGLCYPPQTKLISFDSAAQSGAAATTAIETSTTPPAGGELTPATDTTQPAVVTSEKNGFLSRIGKKLFGSQDDGNPFLPPDEAFIFSVDNSNPNQLAAKWQIADGYYLYREKFHFKLVDAKGVELGTPISPTGEIKVDENFGRMEVYHNSTSITLPLQRSGGEPMEINLEAQYQGCAEGGFCYAPITKVVPVSLNAVTTETPPATSTAAAVPDSSETPLAEQDQIASSLRTHGLGFNIIMFYGFGLLLAFTPCVFPMVPILSSIIVGHGHHIAAKRAFMLSLSYVLAMALTYTVAGVVAGLTGENLQAAFQNPWILGSFSVVFVALALSMFGFYDLQLPSALQSKLTTISNKQAGGTLTGAGIMGFLSALIVGPCVAAPLAGALIYIGQTGDAVLGGIALFALSMGMGTPLLLVGASAGKLLPRAGAWMNAVKAVFGVLLLAVAIWMLSRIIPSEITMLLWAVLAIVSAVYLGALRRLDHGASGWQNLWQGLGIVLLVYGVMLGVGAGMGNSDPLQPLASFGAGGSASAGTVRGAAAAESGSAFQRIKGSNQLDAALAAAKQQGRPVILDFYADWCVSCKEMEKFTFSHPSVSALFDKFVLLQVDVTANDDDDKTLLKRYGIFGPPSIMFYDSQGTELHNQRVIGFMKPDLFLKRMQRTLGEKAA